jgi:hypothetical protein
VKKGFMIHLCYDYKLKGFFRVNHTLSEEINTKGDVTRTAKRLVSDIQNDKPILESALAYKLKYNQDIEAERLLRVKLQDKFGSHYQVAVENKNPVGYKVSVSKIALTFSDLSEEQVDLLLATYKNM